MKHSVTSIRSFIGARKFTESREFYKALGFEERTIAHNMSYFQVQENIGFYLQDAYVKDWINNSMLFLEVDDVERYYNALKALELKKRFPTTKLSPIVNNDWGRECFLHDPSGVLWHFGEFYN